MTKTLATLFALAAFGAAPALARDPSFVSPDQVHAFEIIPAPPAEESEQTKAELAELHKIEAARTEAESTQAKWDDENEHIFLFKTVFGDNFTEEKLPAVAAFGKRVRNDEGINTAPAKDGFHRVRPYNLDKTLHPICKTKEKNDSYPSGHTTSGYLLALSLIDLVPEKRDAILARADGYANDRLVCGVHYRSDLDASKRLAYTIHAIMAQNPQFKQESVAARTELRAALGLPETH
jgi:acid phosphatase (class A)